MPTRQLSPPRHCIPLVTTLVDDPGVPRHYSRRHPRQTMQTMKNTTMKTVETIALLQPRVDQR
jgi:hypothetical protein